MANPPSLANDIAFAQNNGQGPLTVAPNGAITNQHGEKMVYDSSGNLAPAPVPMPQLPGQPPMPMPTAVPPPAPGASPAQPAPVPMPPLPGQPPVPVPPPAPGANPVQPVTYPSRFSSTADAIAYAQSNGQGQLTVAKDGTLTNSFGEKMVYDSDGNLAPRPFNTAPPAPPSAPVQPVVYASRFNSTADAIAYAQSNGQGQLKVASDGTLTNQFGQPMVYDSAGNLAPGPMSSATSAPPAMPVQPAQPVNFASRFNSTADAITFAQSNGQGSLTVAVNGTITNRFGEVMVYDSTGNLAPAPKFVAPMGTMPNGANGANGVGMPMAPGPTNQTFNYAMVSLPTFGSDAYKAILLETGRKDLIGFNYGAHLAVKKETSLPNFGTYIDASSGTELLALLGKVNVNELMASSSPAQVQQLIQKFAKDPAFASFLNTATAAPMPAINTPAYENLLKETGRTNLEGFNLQAHLKVVTESQQTMARTGMTAFNDATNLKVGSSGNDVIRQSDDPMRRVLIGGEGDDQILGGKDGDVLMGGSGNDALNGGEGLDKLVMTSSRANTKITRKADGSYSFKDTTGAEGEDTVVNVERVYLSDVNLAIDVAPDKPAGQTALLIGAVFGPSAVRNPAFVGLGLSLLDSGTSFENLCSLAMSAAGATKPEDVVKLLYTNVIGAAPSFDQAAPFVAMLNQGTSVGALTRMAAELDLTATRVDLAGIAQTGLEFSAS